MNRFRKILLAVGVLLVAAAVAAVVEPQLARPASPTTSADTTITVTGNGTAKAVPDQASFDFGVQARAATASGALSENADQARAIVSALQKAGIDPSQIQTTEVSLWPQTTSDGTQIVGYQASDSVQATVPIARAGKTVDAAVGAGANNVDGPNLSVSDQSATYADALKLALANAKTKAESIAAASGLTLGAVQTVREGGDQPGPYPMFDAAVPTAARVAPPVEAGTQQVQASVSVTYAAS